MSERQQFIQIATAAAENGHSLYALDDEGQVWVYDSEMRFVGAEYRTDFFWKPLETARRIAPAVVSGRSNE